MNLSRRGLRGNCPPLNVTETSSEKLMLRVLLSIQKRYYFKIFGRAVSKWRPEKSFFHDENPGRWTVAFFVVSPRPKVSSSIEVTVENIRKWRSVRHVREMSIPDEQYPRAPELSFTVAQKFLKLQCTGLSRSVESLFAFTRELYPWGNFPANVQNPSIKRRLSL